MAEVNLKERIPRKGSDGPTLQYFNRHVRSLIAHRWEEVGVQLLNDQHQKQINIIKANHHDDVEKCCSSLFNIWIQRQPGDATWRALIEAVRNAHLTNEANEIENMLMTSSASADNSGTTSQLDTMLSPSSPKDSQFVHMKCVVDKLDEEVRREYTKFMTELLSLFTKLQVSKDNVFCTFYWLEGPSAVTSKMRKASDLQSFMLAMSASQSWYNFGTTATLANMYGGSEGKKLVESYEQKLKVQLLKRITFKPPVREVDRIEVKIDEKKECFTEEKITKFRNTLAKYLKLEPEDFIFLTVEEGCVKLTFLFPSEHTPHIKHYIVSSTNDPIQCNVLSVIINGEVVWQRKMSRHKKRDHDDAVTKPKRLKTLPSPFSDITNTHPPRTTTNVSRPVMRSFNFPPSQSGHERQSITRMVSSLNRMICCSTRKRVITMVIMLIIVLVVLHWCWLSSTSL